MASKKYALQKSNKLGLLIKLGDKGIRKDQACANKFQREEGSVAVQTKAQVCKKKIKHSHVFLTKNNVFPTLFMENWPERAAFQSVDVRTVDWQ